jgi:hypothetical protein
MKIAFALMLLISCSKVRQNKRESIKELDQKVLGVSKYNFSEKMKATKCPIIISSLEDAQACYYAGNKKRSYYYYKNKAEKKASDLNNLAVIQLDFKHTALGKKYLADSLEVLPENYLALYNWSLFNFINELDFEGDKRVESFIKRNDRGEPGDFLVGHLEYLKFKQTLSEDQGLVNTALFFETENKISELKVSKGDKKNRVLDEVLSRNLYFPGFGNDE